MAQIGLAFLELPRQTCVGCAEYLHERGMLEIAWEAPMSVMNMPGGSVVMRTYRLAPGVTLADCQEAVRNRHRGPRPWGLD
jgi:hypothetical protein